MARCAARRQGSSSSRGNPPPNTREAASCSTCTCSQKDCRISSSTAVLPAPGPPVSTIRRRSWVAAHSHRTMCPPLGVRRRLEHIGCYAPLFDQRQQTERRIANLRVTQNGPVLAQIVLE